MKKVFLIFSILALIGVLIGCGPVYKREYKFIPPKSNLSKMCTAQCIQGKNACEQNCRMNNENCRARAQESAMYQYREYKHERRREGKSIDKTLSSFDSSSYMCNDSCNCEPTYRSCYSACGGEVLQRDVCVAFCDKQ